MLKTFVCCSLILTTACSSSTILRSSDNDARIFVDEVYVGTGTVVHTDKKIVGASTEVRLEKNGCEPVHYKFKRNEEFDAGACAGGVFLLVPFLWVMRYQPEHEIEFNCKPVQTEVSKKNNDNVKLDN